MNATTLLHGDCREVLATLAPESVDACVSDPPYDLTNRTPDVLGCVNCGRTLGGRDGSPDACPRCGGALTRQRSQQGRGFMGLAWDATGVAFEAETWEAVSRVLKPGAHILACGGTRTYHRMALAIEDAGFEIRDCLAWLYGSGFPKSLNLGEGLGTALKPAYEPIVLARKLFKGSVKGNVEKHGTGALNIDACRVSAPPCAGDGWRPSSSGKTYQDSSPIYGGGRGLGLGDADGAKTYNGDRHDLGRWPANVVLDEIAAACLDEMTEGVIHSAGHARDKMVTTDYNATSYNMSGTVNMRRLGDDGGGSRFFYCAKPSREERDMGIYDLHQRSGGEATARTDGSAGLNSPRAGAGRTGGARNFHPTVKPIELMRWLVRLVTPPNGTVIDPFLGSGTTGIACRYELRGFIGIEREAEYLEIARRRIAAAVPLFGVSA